MTHDTRRILFVCTGNTCRSALAENLFRKMLREAGLTRISVKSAGVNAAPGMPSPREALAALRRRGIDGSGHRAQPVADKLVDWADLILVMGTRHGSTLTTQYPSAAEKTYVLKRFVGVAGEPDIADPIGQPQDVYDACALEIEEALKKLIPKLKKE